MMSMLIQLVLALFLLAGAIWIRRSNNRSRRQSLPHIMGRIILGNDHLSRLSFGCLYSKGIECRSQNLWLSLGGLNGLLGIYRNVGVLVDVLEYIQSNCIHPSSSGVVINVLRSEATGVRIVALTTLLRQSMRHFLGDSEEMLGRTAEDYFSLIADLSLAIHDNWPELMPDYESSMIHI